MSISFFVPKKERILSTNLTIKIGNEEHVVKAIIDTGASDTCFYKKACELFKLKAEKRTGLFKVTNLDFGVSCIRDITIEKEMTYSNVDIIMFNDKEHISKIDVIIGMDVIGKGGMIVQEEGDYYIVYLDNEKILINQQD